MFPMGAVALGSICWPSLLARSGFVELVPVVVHFPQLTWLLAFSGSPGQLDQGFYLSRTGQKFGTLLV